METPFMKKTVSLYISPLLVIICSLIIWIIDIGAIILPIWLFKELCIPIIHFSIINYHIKKNSFRISSIILSCIVYFFTIVASLFVFGSFGRLILFFSVFDVSWSIICGLVIICHGMVHRLVVSKTIKGGIIIGEALIALIVNSLLTWLLSPLLATRLNIDDVELLLLPLSAIILSLFSYWLGASFAQPNLLLKLAVWFLGVMTSVFVSLWLIGSPHIIPFTDYLLTIIWLALSIIILLCSLVGMIVKNNWHDYYKSGNDSNF